MLRGLTRMLLLLLLLLPATTAGTQEIPPIPSDAGVMVLGILRTWDGKVSHGCNAVNVYQKYDEQRKAFLVKAWTAAHCVKTDKPGEFVPDVVADSAGAYISHLRVLSTHEDFAVIQYVSQWGQTIYPTAPLPHNIVPIVIVAHVHWAHEQAEWPTWPSPGIFLNKTVSFVKDYTVWQMYVWGQPGMSGSPVFYNGKVIGILSGGDDPCGPLPWCGSPFSVMSAPYPEVK